ncbi:unnamed protein product [Adineta ricciae]|uniref:Uncharacterized protein n=1 Tax=Adineta ricciae TaxID=249248 RepID=A0A816ACR1_ADIRI|nr:unnamed protein product [Adineta ricciae]
MLLDEISRSLLSKVFRKLERSLVNINIYNRHSRDRTRVYHGVLSTWLYIILLLLSVLMLVLFSNLSNQTINETFSNPTFKQYTKLYETYSTKLICPCSQLLIPYRSFTEFQVRLHQICSSDFIQSSWYERLPPMSFSRRQIHFLSVASSYFQTLATFCNFANETINGASQRFLATNFVNRHFLSNHSFVFTMNSLINQLIMSTRADFHYKMSLTTVSMHSNYYVSNMRVNADLRLEVLSNSTGHYEVIIGVYTPHIYDMKGQNCFCTRDWSCPVNFQINLHNWLTDIDWQLEGIYGGCTIIDSVFKSSMICLFKKSCLTRLRILANMLEFVSVKPLDSELPSRYSSNTLIEKIFDEMMVEDWNYSYSYEQFYHKCQPKSCSVTYERKINIIYIITFIVSLIGGINIILRMISPIIIKIILKLMAKVKRNRITQIPMIQQENHRKLFHTNLFYYEFKELQCFAATNPSNILL